MIFLNIYFVLVCSAFVLLIFLLIKNANTFNNHIKIVKGIYNYRINYIYPEVDYDDMEDYDKTLWRLWDWSYKRILPKEKFEIIKPYIGKKANK